jgi:hypothetical protein
MIGEVWWSRSKDSCLSARECSLASSCHKKAQEEQKEPLSFLCILCLFVAKTYPPLGMHVARVSTDEPSFLSTKLG